MAYLRAYHVTSPDRLGLALAVGGVASGAIVTLLVANGGERAPLALGLTWLVAALGAMAAIVVALGPVWLLLHTYGRRGPLAAALAGGAVLLMLAMLAQAWVPVSPGLGYRWASAALVAVLAGLAGAIVALAMHAVAYRRLM